MSQCHVYAVSGSDVPCPCTTAPSAPPARELLSCPVPNPTSPTLGNRTSDSRHTFHPLPTHIPSLSRLTFHPFVVSTLALSNSSHVSFHGVRTKTFSTHVITKIAPAVREMGLFTHSRASLNFTIISMCTPGVAVPCLCDAGQGCAMLLHHCTIDSSRARIIVMPLCPNSTSPTLGNRTSDPDALSILTLLAFHHSHQALAVTLSFPHPPSPILATFTSMTCALKRFPRTTPRKLSLPCVKRGFLRTAETH